MLTASNNRKFRPGTLGTVVGAASHATWMRLKRSHSEKGSSAVFETIGHGVRRRFGPTPVTWPLVHFPSVGHRTYAIVALHEWRMDVGPTRQIYASRTQIPLVLSWAMTVHRAQGTELPAARVDLSKIFEYGQAYAALSRIRCSDNLQVHGLTGNAVLSDPRIIRLYANPRSFIHPEPDATEL
ncbi:DNA helicase [Tilletia horrida]|nr:DNA helicase [Tilletia horrida]